MSELTYRFLTADDAEIYRDIRLQALKQEPGAFLDTYDEASAWPLERFRESLEKNSQAVCFLGGKPVGHAGIHRLEGAKLRHKSYIWGVYIAPVARGRSASRTLMNMLLDWAMQQDGIELIQLSTDVENETSNALYRSLGFEPYGVERHILKLADGSYVDDRMYVKFLRS